jgi:hypothetical protein
MLSNVTGLVRITAVALLLAMVYYFAGYRIVYSLVMNNAKEEASFAMKSQGSLTNINFSAKEFAGIKWTEKNKEFDYNGELYDLAGIQKNGASFTLHVYCDKNETHWAKAMNDFIKCIFPVGHNNGPVQAEGFLSAFQKEYVPMHKTVIAYCPASAKNAHCTADIKNHRTLLLLKPIWHPPSIS